MLCILASFSIVKLSLDNSLLNSYVCRSGSDGEPGSYRVAKLDATVVAVASGTDEPGIRFRFASSF